MKSLPKVAPSTKSSRLRQNLRSTLLRRIVVGELEAGKPVNESHLATQLKVSRTPLREALLQLEQEGFIRSDERRGFSVERLSVRSHARFEGCPPGRLSGTSESAVFVSALPSLLCLAPHLVGESPVPRLACVPALAAVVLHLEYLEDSRPARHASTVPGTFFFPAVLPSPRSGGRARLYLRRLPFAPAASASAWTTRFWVPDQVSIPPASPRE